MTTQHTEQSERDELIRKLRIAAKTVPCFEVHLFEEAAAMLAESDPNAPWLTEAHMLCMDHGIPHGNITERIKALREKLAEDKNGPIIQRGTNGDGTPWMGTMRECLEDAKEAARVEAAERRRLEALLAADKAGGEPETFEQWNAKQHGDPEEIGFLQALRIAYISGQDSVYRTHPQPAERKPLTDEQILSAWRKTGLPAEYLPHFAAGVMFAEQEHKIGVKE